ncbi:hypothetical protein CMUS01_15804 [Colletotrichum musicola]|uniref:Uncharacterized protein n=1 Tax=Colletotrichum musicola TaxID=2175873 RepID=A0A8H6ITS9_9PEZI|nr:hypothetical protein CMUS01_15804 [Colletotrichum musicola]
MQIKASALVLFASFLSLAGKHFHPEHLALPSPGRVLLT